MAATRTRRPPAPTGAERARSIAARGGQASIVGTGTAPTVPLVHHVRADGSTAMLLPDDDPLLQRVRAAGSDGHAVMLELTDRAPVDLREPVRGLLWITGMLRMPTPFCARRIAVGMAEAMPDPRLLDLGHGATLVRLDPGSAVLSDGEGTAALSPLDLAAAVPDPFCRYETNWLAHLESAHPTVFTALHRHLPAYLRDDRSARIRPLGLDRFGLRLRVETHDQDHDVRLAFEREIRTLDELREQMSKLVGCPFGRAHRHAS
ncbi:Protein of unknown function [Pseudonocardia thermophila]|uniref:DUF2470 domain-containing protein n=1 Tax=Pseudonocardia thermophila TaxID=1848 RepID=A0A1M6VAE4_PSETH|nr:Protein of unknown function [Pseudonocardia thermophila]